MLYSSLAFVPLVQFKSNLLFLRLGLSEDQAHL